MNKDKFKHFFPKIRVRLAFEKNRLWKCVNVEKWSMHGYAHSKDAVEFKSRIEKMLGRYTPELLSDITASDKRNIIERANQSLHHEFDLLGSGLTKLNPIDWHVDFKSGKRWGKTYYNEIGFIKGADIKVPWELSRCQHLLWLGEAYLLTGEKRYAQEIIDEIIWWIEDNPLMNTVNWKCSMDVAFRAVNWLFSLNMIRSFEGLSDSFAQIVEKSLWQHGFFISNNLEKSVPYSNNHYTSDLVGLLYLGQLFKNTKRGKAWKNFAKKELEIEIKKQVLPSGVHYEKSVSYHRMMTEMLSYPEYMLERCGDSFSNESLILINAMYAYVSNYTKPNGLAPLIADNDDGRFLPLLRRNFAEHGYLNNAGSVENRIVSAGTYPKFCTDICGSKIYTDANVAIARSDRYYLFINGGGFSGKPSPNQELINTHTHNDALSFELFVDGRDIIVDPGSYLYTSNKEKRDEFRSTAKHNTVVVDDEEQNGFAESFRLCRNTIFNPLKMKGYFYEGSYQTKRGKMEHQRTYYVLKDRLELRDIIKKEGEKHNASLYFHLAPGLTPRIVNNNVVINGISISFNKVPTRLRVLEDGVSPSFGVLVEAKTVVANFIFDNKLEVITTIIY